MNFDDDGFLNLQKEGWDKLSKFPWLDVAENDFAFKGDVLKEVLLAGNLCAGQILYDNVRAVDFVFAAVCSHLIFQPAQIQSLPVFEFFVFNAPNIMDTTSFRHIIDKLPFKTRPDAVQIIQSTLNKRQDILDGFFCYYHTFLYRTFIAPGLVSIIHSYARINEANVPVILGPLCT